MIGMAGFSPVLFVCLVTVFGVYGQMSPMECPRLTQNSMDGYTCLSTDCVNFTCQLPPDSASMNRTSAIRLNPCNDPPLITLNFQFIRDGAPVNITVQFEESGSVMVEQVNITAFVLRNATSVSFSAMNSEIVLFPLIVYSINMTECQCRSVRDLADIIYSPIEYNCAATPSCNGVDCILNILGQMFHVEVDILSCNDPRAADVFVKDSNNVVLFSHVFNSSGVVNTVIAGFPVTISVLVIHHPYSVDVETNLTVPFYGEFNLFPLHSIILDTSNCSSPPTTPTAQPTPPPTIQPPMPGSPELCWALYNLSIAALSTGLRCVPSLSCTELSCETLGDGWYQFVLLILPREYDIKARIEYQSYQVWEVVEGMQMKSFYQFYTPGYLSMEANATSSVLTLKVIVTTDGQDEVLLPTTSINLPSAAGCLQWISATYNVSQCTYLLDCRGIQCYSVRTIQSATISIAEPCSEVISVQLLLEDFSRNTLLQDSFSNSGVTPFTVQDYNGYIIMSRNDTTLNVSVYTSFGEAITYSLVPPVTIPLNCSCPSLEDLAERIQSPTEHDCATNEDCNGIRCEFEAVGQVFRLETILLSCYDPPALETVLENESNAPLATAIASQSGTYYINVLGFNIPLYVYIVHYNYSMNVSVVAAIGPFGNVTLVPRHTLFLDRSSCHDVVTAPPTSPTTPPTFPSSPSSPICQGLVDIAKKYASEPVVCQVSITDNDDGECDTLACRVDVLSSSYDIHMVFYPPGSEYVAYVRVIEGDQIRSEQQFGEEGKSYKVNVTDGTLIFDFKTQDKAMSIKVAFAPTGLPSRVIIDDEVVLEQKGTSSSSTSSQGVKIGVPIVVVILIIVLVAVVVVVTIWMFKRRQRVRSFEFAKFSNKALEKEEEATSNENPHETDSST